LISQSRGLGDVYKRQAFQPPVLPLRPYLSAAHITQAEDFNNRLHKSMKGQDVWLARKRSAAFRR
jgi:hypothetical protein